MSTIGRWYKHMQDIHLELIFTIHLHPRIYFYVSHLLVYVTIYGSNLPFDICLPLVMPLFEPNMLQQAPKWSPKCLLFYCTVLGTILTPFMHFITINAYYFVIPTACYICQFWGIIIHWINSCMCFLRESSLYTVYWVLLPTSKQLLLSPFCLCSRSTTTKW